MEPGKFPSNGALVTLSVGTISHPFYNWVLVLGQVPNP